MKMYYRFFLFPFLVTLNSCFEMKSQQVAIDMDRVLEQENIMPIAVIGSGPAGLMAAIYGARGGKETYVLEGNKPGGLLMDTTHVENWPGETSIQGPEIIKKLRKQAEHHGVIFVNDAVEEVDFSQWPYKITTEGGTDLSALTIVIATGATPKRLGVPGEELYWGAGVTPCAVCDAPFFKGGDVVVVGGGDSAVEQAIQLSSYAENITILVRKDSMRAAPRMQKRLEDYPMIRVKYNVEVREIVGNGAHVTQVKLYDTRSQKIKEFPTEGVFLAIGHTPNSSLFKNTLSTDASGYITVQGRTQHTSQTGVFAAGDVEDNHYRQAASSAGDGTNAGLDAVHFLEKHGYTPHTSAQITSRFFNEEMASY